MTKFKRSAIVLISALVALCAVFAFGCGGSDTGDDVGGDTEQTKYDVAIRLKCNDLEIYEFPIGTDEKHITIPYDGLDRSFWVDSYNLPAQNDTWSYISDKDAFEMSMTYCAPEGEPSAFYGSVKELGEYIITFETASAPDMWKPRRIVSRFSDDCSFVINEDESPLGWVIMAEGQTMEEAFTRENRVYLERGAVYTAFLAEIDPSGAIEKKHYDYLAFPQDGVVYDDKNNELVIDSSALEEEELFITAQPYGYSLTIIFV